MASTSGDSDSISNSENIDELNLSYSSSPFDDSDGDFIEDNCTIHPYQFEPYADSGASDEDDISDLNNHHHDDRLDSNEWCQCDNCTTMPTLPECVCCMEMQPVVDVKKDSPSIKCITDHPGFKPVCLNLYVLRTAYSGYRQHYKEEMDETQERHRYMAYRQFVRWCWGYLGRHNRVPIPSCVVNKIRETFASTNATGFKWE